MPKLNVDDIVNVIVSVSPTPAPEDRYNIGLILGKTVGDGMSATNRTLKVKNLEDMIVAGYTETSPEYKAAALYFRQKPAPQALVLGLNVGTAGEDGTTYESWLEAVKAARDANNDWYALYIADETALTKAEISAIAAYVENQRMTFFFDDKADEDKAEGSGDIFSLLKAQGYDRTFGVYSNTEYAAASVMGFAMGANTGEANSSYTLAYKTLPGVATEDLSAREVKILQSKNANYYVMRGGKYALLEKGVSVSGRWYDEIIGIDQLAYDLQRRCMDLLKNTRTKIPYTDAGALQFVAACNAACRDALTQGFLAPGVWKGESCMALENGDTLDTGYLCQAEPIADQPLSDKANRICPPIYVCAIMAGAIHSVVIKVDLV